MAGKADFGYINARVRGMKSRLLDKKALDSLIFAPDLSSLMDGLEKTPYNTEITEAKILCSGVACIDAALRKNFTNTFRKILAFTGESEAEVFVHIFLHRWDVQNIKTILRGKKMHITNDEIAWCLVPAGELDEVTLVELIRQPDVRAVIDMLATWGISFAKPLTEYFPEYRNSEDLVVLECALDRYYYDEALKAAPGRSYNERMVRDFIRTEIDIINLKTILRFVRDNVELEEASGYFINGGKEFGMDQLKDLYASHSVEGVIAALSGTSYSLLSSVPESLVKAGKISAFEKELDRLMIRKGMTAFFGDPLSIAPVIGYFWAKYNEVTNIRIITHMKIADVSEENVREELNYV